MKMYGSTYADSLFGTDGKDVITGGAGNDLISAWGGALKGAADKVTGGSGDDMISGFAVQFDNLARSASRGSSVDGGADYDTLIIDSTTAAKNTDLSRLSMVMDVKNVEDIIYSFTALTAKQTIIGTKAAETIYIGETGAGVDGGKGNDNLFGGGGDDRLSGGDGNDFLSGAGGHNELTGGKGADYFQFHLTTDYTYSNINDFEVGVDKIAIVLDTGITGLSASSHGDGVRFLDRLVDDMGYIDYDHGRKIGRGDFSSDSGYFASEIIYEQSTGSVLQVFRDADSNEYEVLLAHVVGDNKALTADDFVFMVI